MMLLAPTFTTLVLIVAMTTVKVKAKVPLTQFLRLPAHKHHRYQFDVLSEASVDDLKAAMSNFTLDHSFKVLGERRYIFTFQSNDTAALRELRFPKGSKVTQYPVETGEQFFEMFDVNPGHWNFPENTKTHPILFFTDWTQNMPKSLCSQTFEMEMKSWVEQAKGLAGKAKPIVHPVIATYPPRVFSFWELEENALQNVASETLPNEFGGVGGSRMEVKRVIRV